MNTSQIIQICQTLTKEGKTPSVALVKARIAGPKNLPAIIAGIKQFQSNPTMVSKEDPNTSSSHTSLAIDGHEALIARVTALENEVRHLKLAIAKLLPNQ